MDSTTAFVKYGVCVSAAAACAAAMAMHPPEQEVAQLRAAAPRSAYLDCARMSAVREPDLVTFCTRLAGAGPQGLPGLAGALEWPGSPPAPVGKPSPEPGTPAPQAPQAGPA